MIITVIVLLFLVLGAQFRLIAVYRNRLRDHDGDAARPNRPPRRARSRQAPLSVIRIAAAPHSVVHVVSAARLGRSHLEVPAGPSA